MYAGHLPRRRQRTGCACLAIERTRFLTLKAGWLWRQREAVESQRVPEATPAANAFRLVFACAEGHRSDTRLHWHVPRGTQRRSPRRVGSRAARRAEPTVAAHLLLETSLSGKRQLAVSGRSSCLGNRGTLRAALQPSPPRSPAAPQVPPSPAKPLPRCTRPARPPVQVSWAQSVEFLSRQRRTYPG